MSDNPAAPKKPVRNNGAVVMMCLSFVCGIAHRAHAED
ncbi:cytochrome c oxidase assembly protein, partial [Rhizobium leguminosarum]